MTATASSTVFLLEDADFGRALAVITSAGVREHDARVALAAARRAGVSAVVSRSGLTGWDIMSRPGWKFTVSQESFFTTVPAGTAERAAAERTRRTAALAADQDDRGCAGCDDREGYGFPYAKHRRGCALGRRAA